MAWLGGRIYVCRREKLLWRAPMSHELLWYTSTDACPRGDLCGKETRTRGLSSLRLLSALSERGAVWSSGPRLYSLSTYWHDCQSMSTSGFSSIVADLRALCLRTRSYGHSHFCVLKIKSTSSAAPRCLASGYLGPQSIVSFSRSFQWKERRRWGWGGRNRFIEKIVYNKTSVQK